MRTLRISVLALLLSALSATAAAHGDWRYEIDASEGGQLSTVAWFPVGVSGELSVGDGAEPFVSEVAVREADAWKPVAPRGTSWFIPVCRQGCQIRYRLDLRGLARRAGDADLAEQSGPVIVAAADAFLLRPLEGDSDSALVLEVKSAPGSGFEIGWPRDASGRAYRARAKDIPLGPYAAFGPWQTRSVAVGEQTVRIAFAPMARALSQDFIAAWIQSCADAVRQYDGAFPIDQTLVLVLPGEGAGLNGKTLGSGGATVLLWLGPDVTEEGLRGEWVLVHELTHLTLPSVSREHHWLEEGVATYIEPLARLRVDQLDAAEVWRQLTWGLPQGLPRRGDEGLDNTHTWGRTYWGGALFWFLADLRIRERTQNRCSVQDALRGIREAGGNLGQHWSIARVLEAGDARIKGRELEEVYEELGPRPGKVDVEAIFKRLGVKRRGRDIKVDDAAPQAALRQAITSTAPSRCP